MEQTIREWAYSKWEAAGCPPGDGVDFWLAAEAEFHAEAKSVEDALRQAMRTTVRKRK